METKKRAILVNVGKYVPEEPLQELSRLAETAGYETVAILTQKRNKPDPATCLGAGKLNELKTVADATECDAVIFDCEINGSQFHHLEENLGIQVMDRSELILNIFAAHAVSNEGKLQVELARKKKALPRIIGKGIALSRQGGGGSGGGGARRGAGEQQLELDKRTIRNEVRDLETQIDKLASERKLRRSRREKNRVKLVAIVGYTNAGKSTLMNLLTNADVLVEDKLFATLDPVGRALWLGEGKEVVIVDTVGFISRLPHELISAFRSTLEETKYADLILHVADVSDAACVAQFDVVREVLNDLGAGEKPILTVFNKDDEPRAEKLPHAERSVLISAKTGKGIDELKEVMVNMLFGAEEGEENKE